ncbi:MaoC family dehydratase [Rhodococcus sp. NPDC003348]
MTAVAVGGPYFDDLAVGQVFDDAPAVTLTGGLAASHQAILGDRLRMPLDAHLSAAVTGSPAPVAHPGLVCDLAIGQSTLVTHHVKANLFYRGLRLHRFPHLGDTLHTRTEVVGLRENAAKPGRAPTGLAALRMRTTDQEGRTVLDFHRCAMLPLGPDADPGRVVHADDLAQIGSDAGRDHRAPAGWDLEVYRDRVPGRHFTPELAGLVLTSSGDVVSSAPELARLTLNIAATHHDERGGQAGRLVYGGHTIGLALSQATRALPNLVTVLGWQSCDHTGPVHEGDTLTSELHVLSATALPDSRAGVLELRSLVHAHDTDEPRPVLDWHFTALMA